MNYLTQNKTIYKPLSFFVLSLLLLGNLGAAATAFAQEAPAEDVQVTIVKYIGDEMATSDSANGSAFQMSATWNADNIGAGTGQYVLSNGNDYEESTTNMSSGADYETNEIFDDVVGASCEAETPFALVGYTSGDSIEDAAGETPSATPPVFTDLTEDQYVIVWNEDCLEPEPAEFVSVHINKYIDEEQADAEAADGAAFLMDAEWDAENIGAGTGQYNLDSDNDYATETVDMTSGADYSTKEVMSTSVVGPTCQTGKPFALVGYTIGDSLEDAEEGTPSMAQPAFTNLTQDQYVIVWNEDCDDEGDDDSEDDGDIEGDVTGGQDENGELNVDSIETIDGSATADGTFANGWKYQFNITVPTDETKLAMKFSDWQHISSPNIIPVANNMRISSAQADNGNATILLTAANVYSTPDLNMVTDLDLLAPGLQIEVLVEVSVPVGSVNGTYTRNYGVKSTN